MPPRTIRTGTDCSRADVPRQPALWTVYVNVSDANASGSSGEGKQLPLFDRLLILQMLLASGEEAW